MAKIFISYRRGDSIDATGRIDDRLAGHFGRDEVFRDVDAIQPGEQFPDSIREALESCRVLLVIIGEDWADARHEDGTKRLHDKNDYVRWEIETALAKGILVIPVLVRWGTLPKSEQLPDSLQPLLKRNATEVRSDRDFHSHVDRLIRDLESHVGNAAPNADALPPLERQVHVVPKGIRSFDADDADFYLDLLPGPRDRHGLPDSIRFWKTRIEETDPTRTFGVGLIYGPSGCGKSSLVKAGLLPRLDKSVTPVFVEASDSDTESRLLRGLQRQFSGLPIDAALETAVEALRTGSLLDSGQKVLIVLDQFEQWLQSHPDVVETELFRALQTCDGERVQCTIMVRDDFMTGASRFLQALDVDQSSERNVSFVDLFDCTHSRKVLTAFGRAYGKLPEASQALTAGQEAFLEQAVAGLADDGRVVAVRLALFADMIKERSWEPKTLQQLGGISGVGVKFLEEKLESRAGNLILRQHTNAVRKVLSVLLPQHGESIRGHHLSFEQLLKASGYSNRRDDCDVMIRALDKEVRLITPTEKECIDDEATDDATKVDELKQYQLTHDYLVPSIREWLTRKQMESRRGRAELRLNEFAQWWTMKPLNRFLPGLMSFAGIVCLTNHKDWSLSQRKMMRQATRYYCTRVAVIGVTMLLLLVTGLEIHGRLKAPDVVNEVVDAKTERLSRLLPGIRYYKRWVVPVLEQRVGPETVIPRAAADRHRVFQTQVNAAIALASLRQCGAVWPLFKHSADPTRRSQLINQYAENGGDLEVLLDKLRQEDTDPSIRRALVLALGQANPKQLKAPSSFGDLLLAICVSDTDPGMHGAATWVLTRWKQNAWLAGEHEQRWLEITKDLATGRTQGERQWYLTKTGLTLVVLPGGESWFGDKPERGSLDHRFAISATEVTVGQFSKFLRAKALEDIHNTEVSPGKGFPVNSVSWYTAAQFCNWLSEQEGVGKAEWCYEPNEAGQYAEGMRIHWKGKGYRLPTEEEWEFACRAGSSTPYFFGDTTELLRSYARYSGDQRSGSPTLPVASVMPNDFGMFDMYGNVLEWCQGMRSPAETTEEVFDNRSRPSRGGWFISVAEDCQSGNPGFSLPDAHGYTFGFRVARTYD